MKKQSLCSICIVTAVAIGMVGCSKPAETEPAEATPATTPTPTPSTAASTPDIQPVKISSLLPVQAYDCLPAQKITATYDRQNPVEPQAMLEINGMIHVLYAVSDTDSVYSTDSGMAEGEGMRWVVEANAATLFAVPSAKAGVAEKVLYRCTHAAV